MWGHIFGKKDSEKKHRKGNSINLDKEKGWVAPFGEKIEIQSKDKQLPPFVVSAVEFLRSGDRIKEAGIFRISGNADNIKKERALWNSGAKREFVDKDDPCEVASLLKLYFRDLPEPVCGFEFYDCFITTMCLPSEDQRPQQLKKVLDLLPDLNRRVLGYVSKFMAEVGQCTDNKMTYENLAICFSPNILKPQVEDIETTISDADRTKNATLLMFTNVDMLWPPSEFGDFLTPVGSDTPHGSEASHGSDKPPEDTPSNSTLTNASATPSSTANARPKRPTSGKMNKALEKEQTVSTLRNEFKTLRLKDKQKNEEMLKSFKTSEERQDFQQRLAERFARIKAGLGDDIVLDNPNAPAQPAKPRMGNTATRLPRESMDTEQYENFFNLAKTTFGCELESKLKSRNPTMLKPTLKVGSVKPTANFKPQGKLLKKPTKTTATATGPANHALPNKPTHTNPKPTATQPVKPTNTAPNGLANSQGSVSHSRSSSTGSNNRASANKPLNPYQVPTSLNSSQAQEFPIPRSESNTSLSSANDDIPPPPPEEPTSRHSSAVPESED